MSEEERVGGEEGSVYEDAVSNCMDAEGRPAHGSGRILTTKQQ